jgi:hypothetical protein
MTVGRMVGTDWTMRAENGQFKPNGDVLCNATLLGR